MEFSSAHHMIIHNQKNMKCFCCGSDQAFKENIKWRRYNNVFFMWVYDNRKV